MPRITGSGTFIPNRLSTFLKERHVALTELRPSSSRPVQQAPIGQFLRRAVRCGIIVQIDLDGRRVRFDRNDEVAFFTQLGK